jgi:hypothetical protein
MGHPMTALVKMGLDQAFMAPAGLAVVRRQQGCLIHPQWQQGGGLPQRPEVAVRAGPSKRPAHQSDYYTAALVYCFRHPPPPAQFYVVISLMEGKTAQQAFNVVRDKFVPTMAANYMVSC